MLRALFILLATMGPLWLTWRFGWWVLVASLALTAVVFLLSTGKARGAEATQGGRLTGYRATSFDETGQ